MRKIVFALAILVGAGVSAQNLTSSKGEPYLPQAGDWSIGFNATNVLNYVGNAFNKDKNDAGNTLFTAADPFFNYSHLQTTKSVTFVGKRFTTDKTADRYTANLNFNLTKKGEEDANTSFGLTAGYGKEWRKGTTRLQGYYGADVLLGVAKPGKDKFGIGIGAQGFVGAEYFIFPKVALGAQYTYGVSFTYEKGEGDKNNQIGFNLGNKEGFGVVAATLNLHF